jgi:agmatine/peptidylarginine deiminase
VVLLAWCDDPSDPQHAISSEALQLLEQETDAKGRKLQVIKLPCPPPLQRTEEEWSSLVGGCLLTLLYFTCSTQQGVACTYVNS